MHSSLSSLISLELHLMPNIDTGFSSFCNSNNKCFTDHTEVSNCSWLYHNKRERERAHPLFCFLLNLIVSYMLSCGKQKLLLFGSSVLGCPALNLHTCISNCLKLWLPVIGYRWSRTRNSGYPNA